MMFTHPADNSTRDELIRIEEGLDKLSKQVSTLTAGGRATAEEEWLLTNEQQQHLSPYSNLRGPFDHANDTAARGTNMGQRQLPVPHMAHVLNGIGRAGDDYENISLNTHIYGEVEQEQESVVKYWMNDPCFGAVTEDRVKVLHFSGKKNQILRKNKNNNHEKRNK